MERDCVMVLFVGQFGTTSACFLQRKRALDIVDVVPILPKDQTKTDNLHHSEY